MSLWLAAQETTQAAGQDAFTLVLTIGGSAAAAAVISGLFARRKTGADAASVLSTASMAQVESYRKEVAEVKAERDRDEAEHKAELQALKARLDDVERQADQDRQSRRELIIWARAVIGVMEKAGLRFDPPPAGVTDSGGHPVYRPT